MQENIQNYIPSDLKFSPSKLYFQHQNVFLHKIWFISPLSFDINFSYTFQEVMQDYFIEWWEFQWITVDHEIQEQWIVYKIWFLNPKYKNISEVSLDLSKWLLNSPSILPMIWWILWWVLVFGLLSWFYSKWQFWQILFILNVIWGWILMLYCGRKIFKYLYEKSNIKSVKYWGFSVKYANQSDMLMVSPEIINLLKYMGKNFWITKFCYTWNCVYLLQDLHDHEWKRLFVSSKLYLEQEKANLQQKTLNFIHQPEFLSCFKEI